MLAYSPHLLVVHPSVPANNLQELVALSHKQTLNFAVTAIGSAPHLAGVAVEKATNAEWEYIPYKGGAQAIGDTVAGQTQVLMNGMLATLPHVQSGKLKVLGVSKATRVPLLPNVPTIAEQGVKGFESGTWQGVLVPADTPPAVVQRLATELTRIIRSPEVRERLVSQGAEVHTMTPPEFATFFETRAQELGDGGGARRRQGRLRRDRTPASMTRRLKHRILQAGRLLPALEARLATAYDVQLPGRRGRPGRLPARARRRVRRPRHLGAGGCRRRADRCATQAARRSPASASASTRSMPRAPRRAASPSATRPTC